MMANLEKLQNFLKTVKAFGGDDGPEDVSGGLEKCLELDWDETAIKIAILITDYPNHGTSYYDDT